LRRVHHEHLQIFMAIQSQDATAARAAMRLHLSNSRERLQRGQQGSS
jgi:GntR family transcriptional repressor for pyruvate dehydrogenase complex